MKLLFDQNLSPKLTSLLSDLYPNSVHVQEVGLGSVSDSDIWKYALEHEFIITTKDADFHERFILSKEKKHPLVVWIKKGNCSTNTIESLLRRHFESILTLTKDVDGFLIIT